MSSPIEQQNNPCTMIRRHQPHTAVLHEHDAARCHKRLFQWQTIKTQLRRALPSQLWNSGLYRDDRRQRRTILINAAENPTDFPAGIYRGLSIAYCPGARVQQIIYNLSFRISSSTHKLFLKGRIVMACQSSHSARFVNRLRGSVLFDAFRRSTSMLKT